MNNNKSVDWSAKFNMGALSEASKASSTTASQNGALMGKFNFGFAKTEVAE